MILGNDDIKQYLHEGRLDIEPVSDDTIRENGVDLRIGDEIIRLTGADSPVKISDKNSLDSVSRKEKVSGSFILNANERILVKIREKVKMPNNLVGFCNVRSTFARLGVFIPPTIVDAGYEGYLTIGISAGSVPVEIEEGTRFLHLVFSTTKSDVSSVYSGKYQNSEGISGAKV